MGAILKQNRIFKFVLVIGLATVFLAILMVLLGSNAQADVIVDQAGGGDYLTIQEGIDNAVPGENVFVWNGSYNENITIDKSIQLIGNGSATTIIDGFGTMNNIINVTAEGVEITGFNITESGMWYGIWANVGGLNIHDNVFDTDAAAIYIDIYGYNSGSTTVGDLIIDNNVITGIEGINIGIFYEKPLPGSDFVFGNTIITNNTIDTTSRGIQWMDSSVIDMQGGSITWGDILINYNFVNTSLDGIFVWGSFSNLTNVNVDIGIIDISENYVNASGGISLDWWDFSSGFYGTTTVTVQSAYIYNNTLSLGGGGIDILSDIIGVDMFDSASISMGDMFIYSNNISSSNIGISVEISDSAKNMHNDSWVTFGNIDIDSNFVDMSKNAITITFDTFGYELYDRSYVILGDIRVNDNDISSGTNGINLDWFQVGYNMKNESSLLIGSIEINPNAINSGEDGIHLDIQNIGYNMEGDATVSLGTLNVIWNTIEANRGINITRIQYLGFNMSDNSVFTWDGLYVENNIINATLYGIYHDRGTFPNFKYIGNWGVWLNGSSSFTMGSIEFNDNVINATEYGIKLEYLSNLGNYLNGESTFNMGDISFNKNQVTTLNSHAMYLDRFNDWGIYMYGNSSFYVGNVTFNDNSITSGDSGIAQYSMERYGYNMYDNSTYMMGDIEFNLNRINSSGDGMFFDDFMEWGKHMYGNAAFLMGDVTFNDNVINSTGRKGITHYKFLQHLGYLMHDESSFQIGDISFSRNIITAATDGIYYDDLDYWGYDMNGSCKFVMGNLTVNDNVITVGSVGISHVTFRYHGYNMKVNSSYQMGNVEFLRNEIQAGTHGLRLWGYHYWGYDLTGSSAFLMGDILINNNKINASDNGILQTSIFGHWGESLKDTSSYTMGDISFCENTIDAGGNGTYLDLWQYWGFNMYESTSFVTGDILFNDNVVNATNFGLYLGRFSHLGNYMDGESTFNMGDISFNKNQVTTLNSHAMYLNRFNDWGSYMYGNSSFYMGNVTFNDNSITSGGNGIAQYSMERYGYNMYDNSTYMMGDIEFNLNRINSSGDGMFFDDFMEWGKHMYGNAAFLMGDVTFNDNVINSTGGKGITHYKFLQHLGYLMHDESSFQIGSISFSRNIISATTDGIYFDDLDYWGYDMNGSCKFVMGNLTVNDNVITAGEEGIYHVTFRYHGYNMKVNSSYQMGNVEFLRNNIQSGADGMILQQFGYWGYDLSGTSTFTMGDILVNHNNIIASGNGIFYEKGVWNFFGYWGWSLNNDSHYTMGDISFSFNTIDAGENGTLLDEWQEWGVWINGSSSVTIGNIYLNYNIINAANDGLKLVELSYICEYLYDDSIFNMGNLEMSFNIINASADGIELYRVRYLGRYIHDNAQSTFMNFLINDNTIIAGRYGIYNNDLKYIARYTYGTSITTLGNIEFNRNTIISTNHGIYLYDTLTDSGAYMYDSSNAFFGHLQVNENNIISDGRGLYYNSFADIGTRLYDQSYFTMANLEICNNTVDSVDDGIYVNRIYDIGYFLYNDSTAVFANFLFTDNNINAGGHGFYINNFWYAGRYLYSNTSAYIGNVLIKNNEIIAGGQGIYFRYQRCGSQLHGNSTATFGITQINDNNITAGWNGTYFSALYIGHEMYDGSTFEIGNIEICGNTINASNNGIEIYRIRDLARDMYDGASATFGDFLFNENIIIAGNDGIYNDYMESFASNTNGNSTATFGNFEFNLNNINSINHGIYLDDTLNDCGYNMRNYSIAIFGHVQVNHNNITSGGYGIWYDYFADTGSRIYDYSYFQMENFEICHNIIDSGDEGIYAYSIYDLGYFLYNDSIAVFGDFLFNDNTITSNENGIHINNFHFIGRYLRHNSSATFGNLMINNNEIDTSKEGIHLRCQRFLTHLYGTSMVVFGQIQMNTNNITSGMNAINFSALYYGQETHDDCTANAGMIQIEGNDLMASEKGIEIYFFNVYYEIFNNSYLSFDDIMISNNIISAQTMGIDIRYEECGDLHNTSTAYLPGINVLGNTVNSSASSFNYFTKNTPTNNDPGATQIWGDVTLESNDFDAGTNGVVMEWGNPDPSVAQPVFYIMNTDIHDGFGVSTGLLLLNITDVYAENITIDTFDYGVYANNSVVHYMFNSSLANCAVMDISLYSASYLFMVNSTFDNASVYFEDFDSLLEVGWFMNVLVQSQTPLPVPDAIVAVADVDGTEIFNSTTNSNGQAFYIICREYQENITGIIKNFNDYTVNATKLGNFGSAVPNPTMNQTRLIVITLLDFIPPTIFSDNSDTAGTTGDPFYFEINASDNMGIVSVHVNYRFDGVGPYMNLTMNGTGPYWLNKIMPSNYVGFIEYYFTAVDSGGFWVNTTPTTAPITDNDPPTIISDNSDIFATTGETFNFIVDATDNINMSEVHVVWWFGAGAPTNDTMSGIGPYTFSIPVPPNSIDQLHYYFTMNDTADNWLVGPQVDINVTDNDAPTYTWDSQPSSGTTGDSVLVSLLATDNIDITYYKIDIDGVLYDLIRDGDYYNFTINIPPDNLTDITYSIIINDTANNPNSTVPTVITVRDNDQPTIISDNSDTLATTGETFNFIVDATDNINVSEVHVVWWFGTGAPTNDTMVGTGPYTFSIPVPPNSLDQLHYYFTVNDTVGNWLVGPQVDINVTDNDAPTYIWVSQPSAGTTGDSVLVSLLATDNIDITYYKIDIDGVIYDLVKDGDYYNYTINIPPDSIANITYSLIINDSANNPNIIPDTVIVVTDNDAPTYNWDSRPTGGLVGSSVLVSLNAYDNIGITNYTIYIDGVPFDMVKDGDYYNYTIDIPPGPPVDIIYNATFRDAAGHIVETGDTVIGVVTVDVDAPEISWILHPTTGTTGESVLVSLLATDNIGITYYKIDIDGTLYDLIKDGDYYNYTINIPLDSVASITYGIVFNDSANNPNSTAPTVITVTDNDAPIYTWISQPSTGTAGESVLVSVRANDNIGITNYIIEIDGTSYDLIKDGDYYNYSINIPPDSLASITYALTFDDAAGNSIVSIDSVITVTEAADIDPPEFTWELHPDVGTTGDSLIVSLLATDNIGVTYYKISIDGILYDLVKDGDYYNYTINIPADNLASITYFVLFNDTANNPNTAADTVITVTDNDPGTISNDQTDASGNEDEGFTFQIDASDNIGISQVRVAYWFGADESQKKFLTLAEENGTYSGSITPDESGTLNYYFEVTDSSDNILEGSQQSAQITSVPKEEEESTILPWILLIMLILVVLIFFFLMTKKRKGEEEISEVEEGEAEEEPEGEELEDGEEQAVEPVEEPEEEWELEKGEEFDVESEESGVEDMESEKISPEEEPKDEIDKINEDVSDKDET